MNKDAAISWCDFKNRPPQLRLHSVPAAIYMQIGVTTDGTWEMISKQVLKVCSCRPMHDVSSSNMRSAWLTEDKSAESIASSRLSVLSIC